MNGERKDPRGLLPSSALVFVVALLYVMTQPYHLGLADESYFLLEAKRIREGAVMYRDLFQIHAPATHWLMAGMFWLFGTSIRTARVVAALVQAGIASLVFASCRRLGVRGIFAAAAVAGHLALCQAPWPYASAHWFATLLMMQILFLTVAPWRQAAPVRWALWPGLAVGGLTIVMHQQAVALAAAVLALFALDHLLGRRFGDVRPWRDLVARTGIFALGAASVALPVVVFLFATIDWHMLYVQFVLQPLTGYRAVNRASWGQVSVLTNSLAIYTRPRLLQLLPVVAGIGALRAAWLWHRRINQPKFDALLALLAVCAGGALAIAYLPDFIHVAFVAPLFLVFWAETLDGATREVGRRIGAPRLVGSMVAGALLLDLAFLLVQNVQRMHRTFPFVRDTPFGPVAFASEREIKLVETVRGLLDTTPTRELFVYPAYTALYLVADADNPTPHPVVHPRYNTPEQVQEVLDIVEAKKLPYVVAVDFLGERESDPILRYVAEHYECFDWGDGTCGLWRRRP